MFWVIKERQFGFTEQRMAEIYNNNIWNTHHSSH